MKTRILLLLVIALATLPALADEGVADARRHMVRGIAAIEMAKNSGELTLAADEFRRATELDPTISSAWYNLGSVQAKLEKFDEAIQSYKRYLLLVPKAEDAQKVQDEIIKLEFRQEQISLRGPQSGKVFKDCPDCPEMVVIPEGSFDMGGIEANEQPNHRVTFKKAFAIGKAEVTQGQWKAIMGNNPSKYSDCGYNCPVENISWSDAKEYIKKLNAKTGKEYRLPSEAEWEYACRAGGQNEYCGSDDVDKVAWFTSNSEDSTHPVAQRQANAWGLFDMSGNVYEWVEDSYHGSYNGAPNDGSEWGGDGTTRVTRGGSWPFNQSFQRASGRLGPKATRPYIFSGFRLARTMQ